MANSSGWGDGAANNTVGWGQGANNAIGWGSSHATSWAGATDIVGLTTDADATAFLNATAITGATQQTAIDNLVKGLKSDGLWSKMKAIYPFATDNRNLLGYTEDFSNAAWSKGGGTTVTANSTIAPDGTTTADTIVIPNNGTISQPLINASSLQTTLSIYLRATANTTIKIGFLSPSVVTTCNVTTSWQRFTITHTFTGTTYPQIYNDSGSSVTLFAWGTQAEISATATTYQPIATTQQAYIASQFKYNLKDPRDLDAAFRLVFNGGWTHSVNGATPNGTNGYADTKFIPSSSFSSNNNSFGVYSRTNNINGENFMGTSTATANRLFMYVKFTALGASQINHNSQTSAIPLLLNSSGYFHSNRIAAGTHKLFVNGALNTTAASNEQGFSTVPIFISSWNNNGTASGFSNRQIAFAHLADGLTDTEATNLYTRVQAFQTALSRQV